MVVAWRVVRADFADTAFSGEGSRLYGGRWTRPGVPAVYLAATRSLAILEVLTQGLDPDALRGLVLASATFADGDVSEPDAVPDDWQALPAPESTARVGTAWAEARASLVLRVPSVVVPEEANYVLNPLHPRMADVALSRPEPLRIDPRLVNR